MLLRTLLLLAAAALCACAGEPPSPAAGGRASASAAAMQAPSGSPTAAATARALAEAQQRVDLARQLLGSWKDGDALMKDARYAAAHHDDRRAQALARDAQGRAQKIIDGQYLVRSARRLHDLYELTGLTDPQLAQMRTAEDALVHGDGARASALLDQLDREIRAGRTHRVGSGESLWTIAAREDVYNNSLLWPLIWDANREQLPDPHRVRAGQVLKIRANPSIDEVVRAVEYARSQLGAQVRIGPVKQANP